jgi:ribonucleoside-diphosphate reductase alpha chain
MQKDLGTMQKLAGPDDKPAAAPKIERSALICPECGTPLVFEGGCNICKNCGWSKCL